MNFPLELTSFVGRERELVLVEGLLTEARLVTLTGSGGSGKTRLAARVASRVASNYPDGVRLVELAAESDPDGVRSRIAGALSITDASSTSMDEVLVERLRTASCLLVLDNCEHLIDACAEVVTRLLRNCDGPTFLCTSQEPLSIGGEAIVRVPPLQLPATVANLSVHDALKSDAVRLFVERGRLIDAAFGLTDSSALTVAKICRRLDGLPLAIELAAARLSLFSPQEILDRLEDRFHLLVGRSRTALSRHQTLRAAVAWSYDLLSESERALFDRLSVFTGSFTVEAAEVVCAIEPGGRDAVVETLERLFLRSMLVNSGGSPSRYTLLDTLRQYAEEQLARRPDEADAIRERHCGYYLDLAISVGPTLRAPKLGEGIQHLEHDVDNLRAALQWALDRHPLAALQAVNALSPFWIDRSELSAARRWTLSALDAATEAPSTDRDEALLSMARLDWARGDVGGTRLYATAALQRARESGRQDHVADALTLLSGAELFDGQADLAEPLQREAYEIRASMRDHEGMASALNNLSLIAAHHGRLSEARALVEEALNMSKPSVSTLCETLARP